MKDKLDKVDEKLDRIEERLDSIDVTLAKQHEQLAHHIYRTELAEENLTILKNEFKPVQRHVEGVSAVMRIIGVASSIVAFIFGVIKLFI